VIRKHRIPASLRHLIPATFVAAAVVLPVTAAALRSTFVLGVWAAMIAAYFVAICAASLDSARRYGWELLPALPIVFAAYHFSYGSGFLLGLIQSGPAEAMTKVTR
jgi:succinoglycan biosynthesis protein ExoA